MDAPVVAELAWAITRTGHPTLRFNFRGVGASVGPHDPERRELDLIAAEAHLRASLGDGDRPLGACGVGRGADLVLRRAASTTGTYEAVVAVAPTAPLPDGLARFAGPCVVIRAQRDPTDPAPLRAALEAVPGGRLATIPRADPAFVRGLVHLGQVAAQVFSAPGELDLGG